MASVQDVRRLMKETRSLKQNKIDAPHAKYSKLGQLICSVCQVQINSDQFAWDAHAASKKHKEAVAAHKLTAQSQPEPSLSRRKVQINEEVLDESVASTVIDESPRQPVKTAESIATMRAKLDAELENFQREIKEDLDALDAVEKEDEDETSFRREVEEEQEQISLEDRVKSLRDQADMMKATAKKPGLKGPTSKKRPVLDEEAEVLNDDEDAWRARGIMKKRS